MQAQILKEQRDGPFDSHPFEMVMAMNSSICHGGIQCFDGHIQYQRLPP